MSALDRYSKKVSLAAKVGASAPPADGPAGGEGEDKLMALESYVDATEAIGEYVECGASAIDPTLKTAFAQCVEHQKAISNILSEWLKDNGVLL